jgi:hypothetical protein
MMLNNSSRFPSRRPSCRPFALVLVGREGKSGERSELVHQMKASVNQSPTRRRHCGSNIGESGHYRSGATPKENLDVIFPLFFRGC